MQSILVTTEQEREQRKMNETKISIPQADRALVIYHDNCMDGFGSAWAFHMLKEREYGEKNVMYFPCSYGNIPDLTLLGNTDVYILDFSFPRFDLKNFAEVANKIVILDHHKTAQEALENWEDKPENVEIVFDMKRSGAGITWDYFDSSPRMRPPLIKYIEDRDIWKFVLPYSKEVNAVIAATDTAFENYSNINLTLIHNLEAAANSGSLLLRQHNKLVQEMLKHAGQININSHVGLIVNSIPQLASDIGNELAKISGTFGGSYYLDKDGKVHFSLRSIGEYDVSAIARTFGGGGHKNAAGFTFTPEGSSENVAIWTLDSESLGEPGESNGVS